MLLCISHTKGARYYLGDWTGEKFTPRFHARMNWNDWECFAPESVVAADGRRVMWAWCLLKNLPVQSGIQSLPRELSLPADGVLRIKPLRELESLRQEEHRESNVVVKADANHKFAGIAGDTIEIQATISPGKATQFGLRVFADSAGGAGFPITVDPSAKTLNLGTMKVPFELKLDEDLQLRVFLDKNMVEVFANDRHAAVAQYKYAAGKLGVSAFGHGGDVNVKEIKGWRMKSIYGEGWAK